MLRVSGCAEEVLMCVCRLNVEVCGVGVVFVEYNCDVEEMRASR